MVLMAPNSSWLRQATAIQKALLDMPAQWRMLAEDQPPDVAEAIAALIRCGAVEQRFRLRRLRHTREVVYIVRGDYRPALMQDAPRWFDGCADILESNAREVRLTDDGRQMQADLRESTTERDRLREADPDDYELEDRAAAYAGEQFKIVQWAMTHLAPGCVTPEEIVEPMDGVSPKKHSQRSTATRQEKAILALGDILKTSGKLPSKKAIAELLDVDPRTMRNWTAFNAAYSKLKAERQRDIPRGTKVDGVVEAKAEKRK